MTDAKRADRRARLSPTQNDKIYRSRDVSVFGGQAAGDGVIHGNKRAVATRRPVFSDVPRSSDVYYQNEGENAPRRRQPQATPVVRNLPASAPPVAGGEVIVVTSADQVRTAVDTAVNRVLAGQSALISAPDFKLVQRVRTAADQLIGQGRLTEEQRLSVMIAHVPQAAAEKAETTPPLVAAPVAQDPPVAVSIPFEKIPESHILGTEVPRPEEVVTAPAVPEPAEMFIEENSTEAAVIPAETIGTVETIPAETIGEVETIPADATGSEPAEEGTVRRTPTRGRRTGRGA